MPEGIMTGSNGVCITYRSPLQCGLRIGNEECEMKTGSWRIDEDGDGKWELEDGRWRWRWS